ncbi:MAG: 3-deoxy-manno-octulosonate cytidylyltransferase [Candidatus Sumerlaeia bacterium]|nr:3-deoxy-manno-octulosonate cytidylyltransferase [Candidatus Sumerlaeia bacterium]
MEIIGVIPARYASTRFPGKPLADLGGKPLIQWVYERATAVPQIKTVYIATDDERIAQVVTKFGGQVIMTSVTCASGTDRIAEALKDRKADIVVNIQGDEPLIDPQAIDRAISVLLESPECMVSTLAVPITEEVVFNSPNVVKVVFDRNKVALYFCGSPIPSAARRDMPVSGISHFDDGDVDYFKVLGYKHLGMYVYRREALEKFCRIPPSPLEQIEKLEQLRFLENGMPIKVVITTADSPGIDTPEELMHLRNKLFGK